MSIHSLQFPDHLEFSTALACWLQQASFSDYLSVLHTHPHFQTLGEQHRKQKKILNPVFATSHVREMSLSSFLVVLLVIDIVSAPIFYDVVHKVCLYVSHWFFNC